MNIKPSKCYVLRRIEEAVNKNPALKILDLGSGHSKIFLSLLEKYPDLYYIAVEPINSIAQEAKKILRKYKNAKVINGLAYPKLILPHFGNFDIVCSLSVLEHVKDLKSFLHFSSDALKKDGQLMHLYDLGHALHPTSLKERLLVILCNNFLTKKVIPETKFANYVNKQQVLKALNESGIEVVEVTHHNMPMLVTFLKQLDDSQQSQIFLEAIMDLEKNASVLFEYQKINPALMEYLLPSICIWGIKK